MTIIHPSSEGATGDSHAGDVTPARRVLIINRHDTFDDLESAEVPRPPLGAVVYVDTGGLRLEAAPDPDLARALESECGELVFNQDPMRYHPDYRCWLRCHRPTITGYHLLDAIMAAQPGNVPPLFNVLHVALDLLARDRHHAMQLKEFIDAHHSQRRHGKMHNVVHAGSVRYAGPKIRSQQLVTYGDEPS